MNILDNVVIGFINEINRMSLCILVEKSTIRYVQNPINNIDNNFERRSCTSLTSYQ